MPSATLSGTLDPVHPTLFRLGLPQGGYVSIHSLGLCITLAIWFGWYVLLRRTDPSERNSLGRTYALGLLTGAAVAVAARFAHADGAWPAFLGTSVIWMGHRQRNAFAAPLALLWAAGALGAWLDGWLFGVPAEGALASCSAFPVGSPAHMAHHAAGLIHSASSHSLPTEPVALYHLLGATGLFAFALNTARRWAAPAVLGSFAIVTLATHSLRADAFAGDGAQAIALLALAGAVIAAFATKRHDTPGDVLRTAR